MPLPLMALGGLASAGSAAAHLLGGRRRRRAARQGRAEERGRLNRAKERLADVYRRRNIRMAENNVGLEGSSVAKGRENELAQHQAWDTADLNSAEKLASIRDRSSKYDERLANFGEIAGIVGGTAAGLSGMFPPSSVAPPAIQGNNMYDDDEIQRMLGLK